MLDDLFICGMFVAIAFFVYKWFELIILKKERLNIVSRLEGEHLLEYAKRLPIGVKSGGVSQEEGGTHIVHPIGKVLRWGLLAIGIGAGFLTAFEFVDGTDYAQPIVYHQENMRDLICAGWILMCGGVSLVLSFIIEYFLFKREE
jgi:hypothetical protein